MKLKKYQCVVIVECAFILFIIFIHSFMIFPSGWNVWWNLLNKGVFRLDTIGLLKVNQSKFPLIIQKKFRVWIHPGIPWSMTWNCWRVEKKKITYSFLWHYYYYYKNIVFVSIQIGIVRGLSPPLGYKQIHQHNTVQLSTQLSL